MNMFSKTLALLALESCLLIEGGQICALVRTNSKVLASAGAECLVQKQRTALCAEFDHDAPNTGLGKCPDPGIRFKYLPNNKIQFYVETATIGKEIWYSYHDVCNDAFVQQCIEKGDGTHSWITFDGISGYPYSHQIVTYLDCDNTNQ
jgi:hypothetical protein